MNWWELVYTGCGSGKDGTEQRLKAETNYLMGRYFAQIKNLPINSLISSPINSSINFPRE